MADRGEVVVPVGLQSGYTHKLDSKGRMVLPARLRNELGQSVVATIGFEGRERFVAVYPQSNWEVYFARLEEMSSDTSESRNYRRIILASAHEIEIDGMGRILVPQQLRDYAGIAQEVSVNGNGGRLEIWDKAAWEIFWDAQVKDLQEKGNRGL